MAAPYYVQTRTKRRLRCPDQPDPRPDPNPNPNLNPTLWGALGLLSRSAGAVLSLRAILKTLLVAKNRKIAKPTRTLRLPCCPGPHACLPPRSCEILFGDINYLSPPEDMQICNDVLHALWRLRCLPSAITYVVRPFFAMKCVAAAAFLALVATTNGFVVSPSSTGALKSATAAAVQAQARSRFMSRRVAGAPVSAGALKMSTPSTSMNDGQQPTLEQVSPGRLSLSVWQASLLVRCMLAQSWSS